MSSNTPRRSILRASALMASGTMVSRILGFVRNAMLIAAVGATAGGVGAAFQTANTLPNTVFNLLASGIFDAVLVPQIVGAIKRRHDGDTYVNRLLTLAGTLLFLVTFATMVLAPVLLLGRQPLVHKTPIYSQIQKSIQIYFSAQIAICFSFFCFVLRRTSKVQFVIYALTIIC